MSELGKTVWLISLALLFCSGIAFGGYLRNYRHTPQSTLIAHLWQWLPLFAGAACYFFDGALFLWLYQLRSIYSDFFYLGYIGTIAVTPGVGYVLGYHLWVQEDDKI